MIGKDYDHLLVQCEMNSVFGSNRAFGLLTGFVIVGVLALGVIGWVANGSALFLAMADSLAAWCM